VRTGASLPRRHLNAAGNSSSAAPIHSVISAGVTHPAGTAAVHDPRIVGSAWRIPRLSRGSGIAAKHSSRLPPLTRCSTAARSAKTAIAASTDDGTFWVPTHWTRNGATNRTKDP
jgi:hypothetical protein